MKKILIIYSKMVTGGSTTSLLSLLNGIDHTSYSVDLLLYDNSGELQDQINSNVNILPEMKTSVNRSKKCLIPGYWRDLLKARVLSKKHKNRLINSQFMSKYEATACPKLKEEYDAAISFLEFWPMEYLARRVTAKKKIGWIHIDIKEAGLLVGINDDTFNRLDNIILVSKSCVENMRSLYPQYENKISCVENILVQETIVNMSMQPAAVECTNDGICFVTVCRLVCASKGLDRGVNAFGKLKREGLLPQNVRWYIIGEGPDRPILEKMISEYGLTDTIVLLGQHKNPYAIEKSMDIFLLPSRYEGKPMAVTEAQMLGLIPMVCNYSSASEQILNGVDGIICDNNDTSIYYAIRDAIQGDIDLPRMKENVTARNYSNMEEIEKVYALL